MLDALQFDEAKQRQSNAGRAPGSNEKVAFAFEDTNVTSNAFLDPLFGFTSFLTLQFMYIP